MSLCNFTDLYLLQEKVALHKAVAEESPGGFTVLEKAGWVGSSSGVGPHQLTVVRHQGLRDLWEQRGHMREKHETVNTSLCHKDSFKQALEQ